MPKLIVDVEDNKLHSDFKRYCLDKNKSMKDIVIGFMERCVKCKE